jgi:hypothetical protein
MEVIGAVASVIAVIDLSVKVGSILFQYSKDVKHAEADSQRLCDQLASLRHVSESLQLLLQGPHGARLQTSQSLVAALHGSRSQLEELKLKFDATKRRSKLSYIYIRLKWPLESKEVEKIVKNLTGYTQIISSALQIDNT